MVDDYRQRLIDDLANTALTQDEFTKGLTLRARSPIGKQRMTELLNTLVPDLVQVNGAFPDDHYRSKAQGMLESSRRDLFLEVATELRSFIVEDVFEKDDNFRTFVWKNVIAYYEARGREVPLPLEGARYVFMCIGAWGGGADQWMRPLPEMLEAILDVHSISILQLLDIAAAKLFPPAPPMHGRVFTPTVRGEPPMPTKIFLIHGRNHGVRDRVHLHLKADLKLDVVVMEAGAHGGRTLPEKFEDMARECAFAVCILSGDDEITLHLPGSPDDGKRVRRPRQNVVLELGFFWGALGRERLAVLVDPADERPSDINGIGWIPITPDLGQTKLDLQRELRNVGLIL